MNARTGTSRLAVREQIYEELRRRLMAGEFSVRDRLVETKVAELLGASRTPVREALVRLHAEGLLTCEGSGYFPVIPDLATVRDLYEVRITLELRGIDRVIENFRLGYDLAALAELRQEWRNHLQSPPAPGADIVLLDEDFHIRLSGAAGNAPLTRMLQSVNSQIRLVRMYDYSTEARVLATITEHLAILDAIFAGDLEAARTALHEHVGASYDVVEAAAARAVTTHFLGTAIANVDLAETI